MCELHKAWLYIYIWYIWYIYMIYIYMIYMIYIWYLIYLDCIYVYLYIWSSPGHRMSCMSGKKEASINQYILFFYTFCTSGTAWCAGTLPIPHVDHMVRFQCHSYPSYPNARPMIPVCRAASTACTCMGTKFWAKGVVYVVLFFNMSNMI